MKKIIFLIIGFYFLTLFQTSFFPHLASGHWLTPTPKFGVGLNLVLMVVILINFLEAQKEKLGLFSAFFGGFFLDIFSERFFGFWILVLVTIAVFIKFFLKKYLKL